MELSNKEFRVLSSFVEKCYGIQMPSSKKVMLQTRLQKRAYQIGMGSLSEYVDFLFSDRGQESELDHFAAIVSTHKTDFFREIDHFSVLRQLLLPELLENGIDNGLEIWSCASSTGEEIYSIAITIYDFFRSLGHSFPHFNVTGTDISQDIIEFARKGIYNHDLLSTIPVHYRQYLMRSKDPKKHAIRIVPEIRQFTKFYMQNLMDEKYSIRKEVHIIFCRNVLIYFDRKTQETILRKLIDILLPGGFLLIGHSETTTGINLPVEQVQATVYRKK